MSHETCYLFDVLETHIETTASIAFEGHIPPADDIETWRKRNPLAALGRAGGWAPRRRERSRDSEFGLVTNGLFQTLCSNVIKGSWEAILPRYGQIEFWVLKWWRVVRDWHLTLKGGVRLRLDLEGWCAIEKGWCAIDTWPWRVVWRVVCDWDLTLKGGARLRKGGARLTLDLEGWCEGWCAIETWPWRVVRDWDLTLKGGVRLRLDLEGWCAIETWPWRVVWDFTWPWWRVVADRIETWPWRVLRDWDLILKGGVRLRLDLEGCCAIETWPWRVVCDWDLTLMKGGCRSHCNGSMNVAWAMFWGGSRSTKPCVFPGKVAAGDDERYLVCATGAAAVVPDAIGSFYVFCNKWLFLWCSSMRFLKLWLQIAL